MNYTWRASSNAWGFSSKVRISWLIVMYNLILIEWDGSLGLLDGEWEADVLDIYVQIWSY